MHTRGITIKNRLFVPLPFSFLPLTYTHINTPTLQQAHHKLNIPFPALGLLCFFNFCFSLPLNSNYSIDRLLSTSSTTRD
ncbi:uncharacterized protein F4822DRAFT_408680 [Hypoxylon trugodes]|uniref:uncharacterized protein n=1 Tax=Hypoxylon trugodes TaxID=326681 RepID=UPI00219CD5EE|nr:uncharacterized protein F4822DRAFT_408680 [Hypoxylon trugodes]KAI1388123.1 hypothetical protein F4822DRAFT_408680 [Hypoxylon trugodes]